MTPSSTAQDEINLRLYRSRSTVSEYAVRTLMVPEVAALVRYRDDFRQRRVLELGCGAGRLAAHLGPMTDCYVGVDVSPHMVDYCRRTFPGLSFVQGDMRDLSQFDAGSFDTVVAINNLFDAVSHDDRLRVLGEVRRVLAPGGLLLFSGHNRNCAEGTGEPRLALSRNPYLLLRNVVEYMRCLANRRRITPMQRFEPDYALLNDCGHRYSVLHYYIRRSAQATQLAGAGFDLVECLDHLGRTLAATDDDSSCSSVHYLARPRD